MTPDAAAASHARQITATGQTVGLRRKVDGVLVSDVTGLRARVRHASPSEVTAGMSQKARKVIVLAADVVASGFPLPMKTAVDQAVFSDGVVLAITDIDGISRLGAAYELTAG
jgi:hypothetical protein